MKIFAADVKDWWWLPIVWGIANVLALVGVIIAVWQLIADRSRRVRFLLRPVCDANGSNVEVSVISRLAGPMPLVRAVWTDTARRRDPIEDRPQVVDLNQRLAPRVRTFLTPMPIPGRPFVLVIQTHDGELIFSRRLNPDRLHRASFERFSTDDLLPSRAIRRLRGPMRGEVPSRAPVRP